MEQVIPLLILGLLAGILSGMFGIGGGVVIVPVLVTLFGYELYRAVGTSLAALLLPVSIFAVLEYYRAGKLRIRTSALVAVGLIVGGYFGAQLALGLPVGTLQRLYGAFLLYASWRFAEPRKWLAEIRAGEKPQAVAGTESSAVWYALLALGFGAGIVSGMFGVGGGIVIVPALVAFLKFDQKMAVGTSLGALLLPVGLGGVISYYQAGQLDIGVAALIALGLVVGALGGARLALRLPEKTIKRLYGIFLLFVALRFLLQVA
ncbi:MAG: sulfite exporter TauE/SafE family protein [Anaerolinea sp.]|nr:sulfite exporter TauE/SafE family protein [Anaerolinea sp.]